MFNRLFRNSKKKKKDKDKKTEKGDVLIRSNESRNESVVSSFQFTQTVREKVIENGVVTKETITETTNASPTAKFNFDAFTPRYATVPTKHFDASSSLFNRPLTSIPTSDQLELNKYKPKPARSTFQYSSLRTKPVNVLTYAPYGSNQSLKNISSTDRTLPLTSQTRQQSYTVNDLKKPITIHVKKTYRFYDKVNKVPTYATHGSKRGSLLLINNMQFEKNKNAERRGAEIDEKNIKELFKQLGFQIEAHRNLKKDDMMSALKKYSKRQTLKTMDINVVVMMSHGMGKRGGDTFIMGSDDKELAISDVIDRFSNQNCTALVDKPKIFIFQCCRGSAFQAVESDATVYQLSKKIESDILLAYSTIPGFVSHRNPELGTWYIQAICKVFMDHACDTHIEDLLKMVDEMLSSLAHNAGYTQTSSYESRGFKKCYLHPM